MEGRRGALNLSEEIELCGRLRNDIGDALKTDAHNAAKALKESDECKAVETLVESEALHLEESVAAAETSFLHATASIEQIEVATAHLHETNSVLSQQLDKSLQLIDESTEALEELRRRHVSFCQVQEEAHKRMSSLEALLRSIMNGEERTRGLKAEQQTLKSAIEVLERTKDELFPLLESCRKAFDCVKLEYEQSKKNNAQHLELIERCREEEEQLKARNPPQKMARLRDEQSDLCARKAALEAEVSQVQNALTAEMQNAAQQQKEALEKHEKCSRLLEDRRHARQDIERNLNLLKEQIDKATEEMYCTVERMKDLRKQDAELAHKQQKVTELLKNEQDVFAELKETENVLKEFRDAQEKAISLTESLQREEKKLIGLRGVLEVTRMEQTEMEALRDNERAVLSEGLQVLQTAEKEAKEAAGAGEELEGLIEALEIIWTEQKEITQTLILSRSRADLQLKNTQTNVFQADIVESRLNELRRVQAALMEQIKGKECEREKDDAVIKQLQVEASEQKLQLEKLVQEHVKMQRSLLGLRAKHAEEQENQNARETEQQAELLRIRNELQAKYEAACAQVRADCQREYTAMLNRTLEDEEGRLACEKRSKMEQIAALVEGTTGSTPEIDTGRSVLDHS